MSARTKPKAASGRASRARLGDIRDFGEHGAEPARGGVQSIGRAFAIIEEIARNRDGIGLADL